MGARGLAHVGRSCFPVPTMDDGRWTMALSSIVTRTSNEYPQGCTSVLGRMVTLSRSWLFHFT